MNQVMIDRWNEVVRDKDDVYHLGDISFASSEKTKEILFQLNGCKFLIRGNHDGKADEFYLHAGFSWVKSYYELNVHDVYETEDGTIRQYHQPIILSHYPFLSWNGMSNGSWHFHGHCHGTLPKTNSLRFDVGVDTNNYVPWSYENIKIELSLRTVRPQVIDRDVIHE